MTDLRARVLAHLGELIEAAQIVGTHSPGPWHVEVSPHYIYDSADKPVTTDQMIFGPTKHYIAAHSPDRTLRLYEGLRAEVERHVFRSAISRTCQGCFLVIPRSAGDDCPFVRRLAAMLGLNTEPATPGGSSE